MAATASQVKNYIKQGFPGATSNIQELPNGRIVGELRSPEFVGMSFEDRNKLVTERIRSKLGLDSLNVGIIYPLAPGEAP